MVQITENHDSEIPGKSGRIPFVILKMPYFVMLFDKGGRL